MQNNYYMSKHNIFNIREITSTEHESVATIDLDAEDLVFKGHFPNQPVLPGVIMLKIIIECACEIQAEKLQLRKVIQAKYLQFVDPRQYPLIQCKLNFSKDENGWKINALFFHSEVTFSKILLICAA